MVDVQRSEHAGGPARPILHFTPIEGWLNDPNGLVVADGEHHLFYQHNPHDDVWGPMHWGHAVSSDLIAWERLPIALHPDEHGWIYSGSAVLDTHDSAGLGEDAMVAVFTYASADGQSQGLASSLDRGRTWTPFEGNPVLLPPEGLADFRDPKVFRWECDEGGHWVMVLAAGRQVLIYASDDLRVWEPVGEVSPRPGDEGTIWETPDLFPLRIAETGERRWVLSLAAMTGAPAGGGGTCYLVGDFDGRQFLSSWPEPVWADHGPDFYAAQSWNGLSESDRVWVAWMGDWSYAQEVPSAGWRGVMSIPRRLGLVDTPAGPRLTQEPIAQLGDVLEPVLSLGPGRLAAAGPEQPGDRDALSRARAECFDLRLSLEVDPVDLGAAVGECAVELRVHSGEHEWTSVTYDLREASVSLDRSRSGPAPFHREHGSRCSAPLDPVDGVVQLRVVGDTCSMEVFGHAGSPALSALVYPSTHGFTFGLRALGAAPVRLRSLEIRVPRGSAGAP